MALVTGVLGSVIPKLGELLKEEYDLQTGVKKKIVCLSRDLESMHAALRKVAKVPSDQLDEQVKLWARDVRELSYDVENILDTFLVRVQGPEARDPNRYKRAAKKIGKLFTKSKARHKIASMIQSMNEQADVVAERHRRYRAEDIVASRPAATLTVDPRLAAMYEEVTQLVGIEKPSAEIISMLSAQQRDGVSNMKMKMVSIVGVGGLGKTTLAKVVYDKLKVDFQHTAFVLVGQNPDLKKVFRDLLIELDKKKYMDPKWTMLGERQLIDELREYLCDKRYFIIIDDIWETKSWEIMKLALVDNKCGSRLITTTRKLEVARNVGDVYYKLERLAYDKSKKLFYTRIFGATSKCPDNQLDEASDKILKKCDGVPLAIITMASLLVGKSREEWIEVCNAIVFRDKDNKQVSDTEWILSLSYYDLPAHLKTCLLYLSAFPEDYVIDKDAVIWKWIAEGFVNDKPGTWLYEVGEGYFNELINRSMIQAVSPKENGIVDKCRIHDMVLDLLRLKSMEENFITISSDAERTSSPSKVRRLAYQNKTVKQTYQDIQMDHLRTFIACRCSIVDRRLSFRNFKLVRVLALDDCNTVNLEHVENLLHLRYLRLRGTHIGKLPEEIGALKFLQTLDLKETFVKDLPSSVGMLTQLICLRAGDATVPTGVLEKLTSLEELQMDVSGDNVSQVVKVLGKLRELRVLMVKMPVEEETMQSDLVESLGNLHKIRYFTLSFISWPDKAVWDAAVLGRSLRYLIVPNICFFALPSCINPLNLPSLSLLDLYVYDMDEQDMKTLSRLPELHHLKLRTSSTVTIIVHAADCFFQKLESLLLSVSTVQFVHNEDLSVSFTTWNSNRDGMAFGAKKGNECIVAPIVMPNLQVLHFYVDVQALIRNNGSCNNLGLEYLPSLQKVKVKFCCFDAFADEAEKEEAALMHVIQFHPNRPTLEIRSMGKYRMKKSRQAEDDLVTKEQKHTSYVSH